LGDGTDPGAKFDAVAAKAEYQAWDPTGAKAKGLVYTYDTNTFNKALCTNLAAQWLQNLGVTVQCVEVDGGNFFDQRSRCAYSAFRQSWSADYNHPQDWYDYLFVKNAPSNGSTGSTIPSTKVVYPISHPPFVAIGRKSRLAPSSPDTPESEQSSVQRALPRTIS